MKNLIKSNQVLKNSNSKLKTDKKHDKIFTKFYFLKTFMLLKQKNNFNIIKKTIISEKRKYYKKHNIEFQKNRITKSIFYIRYTSNFLIGIIGSKKFAIEIKNKITGFIKTNLHLQIKKNIVLNKNNKSILFLGFRIKFLTRPAKTKKILTEKEAIFRYKKRSIAKMTSLKIKIGKSFRIALIKAICETASHKIKFSETIKKKNFNSLARKILFDIEFNKLSKNAKNLFFNIKNLKQELNKLDNNNINQFIEILETLPIPKFKLQESLVSAELCKLKNEFLQSLEKLQHILNESFYENPPSFLFSQKEDVFNKMKDGPKVIQKKK